MSLYNQLAAVYHKMETIPVVRWAGERYLHGGPVGNANAYRRLASLHAGKVGRSQPGEASAPLNVVFVQQHKVNWDIVRVLYEKMLDDARFNVYLVAVDEPHDVDHDAVYRLLVGLYGGEAVIKAEGPGGLFDLKSLNPDYVFLPRPYDQYLPKPYRSGVVSRYASVAYVPYGADFFSDVDGDFMNGRFCRNVSYFFADCDRVAEMQRSAYPVSHKTGVMSTLVTGLPYLTRYAELEHEAHDGFNVLWTPRWGEEANLGGSSFMSFKDGIVSYVESRDNMRLLFRPHPFMFEHFISTGRITERDAQAYLERFADDDKYRYDTAPDLYESFAASDVLVTDVSSIIVPYLVTGKPVVLCETGAHLSDIGLQALEVMYKAEDLLDALALVELLRDGYDPLREKRERMVKDLFLPNGADPSATIMDVLAQE